MVSIIRDGEAPFSFFYYSNPADADFSANHGSVKVSVHRLQFFKQRNVGNKQKKKVQNQKGEKAGSFQRDEPNSSIKSVPGGRATK